MAIIKETIPFTYDDNYQEIVKRLMEKGWDAPYEGSNTAVIASALAYTVSSLNFNTAVNINENILTLATKRKNIVQDARILSYEPSYKKSTILKIALEFPRTGFYKLPKYSQFTINGFNYVYFGDDLEYNIVVPNDVKEIEVKEGLLYKTEDLPDILTYRIDEKLQYIDIPWNDVENDGVEVFVDFFDDFGNKIDNTQFSKASSNIVDVNDNNTNKFWRKDDLASGNCRIYFKLGTAGDGLPPNAIIYINILRTSGSKAYYEGINSATPKGDIASFCRVIKDGARAPQLISQAQDEESIENIKNNAPLFFNSSARTVVASDYDAILRTHTSVKNCKTWGGEDEYPLNPGNLYFTAEPNRREQPYGVYQKVRESNGAFIYKKDAEAYQNGAQTADSLNQFYINTNYRNESDLYLNPGEVVSTDVVNGRYLNPGIFDLVDTYDLPSLISNLKNPSYINIDLAIAIKQYPFGTPKSEIRSKLYTKIREKLGEMEKFEGEYIHSNLIRYLDDELGIGNGIEITPYFSVILSEQNQTKQYIEDLSFNKINNFYAKNYDEKTKTLNISVYVSLLAEVGDKLKFYFNKTDIEALNGKEYYEYSYTEADIKQSYKLFKFKDTGADISSLAVSLSSYDGTSSQVGTDINLFNFKNKTIYFYSSVGLELSNIKVCLPRFVRPGDKIEVYGKYDTAKQLLHTFIVSQEHLNEGFIQCDDLQRGQYAGIVKAQDYGVTFTSNHKDLVPAEDEKPVNGLYSNQIEGTYAATFETAKQLTESQDNIFSNLDSAELYYNFFEEVDGSLNLRIWLPTTAAAGDNLYIDYASNRTTLVLTPNHIRQNIIDTKVEGVNLDLNRIVFEGADKSIGIYPTFTQRSSVLSPVGDDRIQFSNTILENYIEYTPTTTADRRLTLKDLNNITFYTNYNNKFDVRNLIANFDETTTNYEVTFPVDSPLTFDRPYVVLNQHKRPVTLIFNINVREGVDGDLLYKPVNIFVKEPSVNLSSDEGPGGAYVYLDMPVENIYDETGKLLFDNLPKFELTTFKEKPGAGENGEKPLFQINPVSYDFGSKNTLEVKLETDLTDNEIRPYNLRIDNPEKLKIETNIDIKKKIITITRLDNAKFERILLDLVDEKQTIRLQFTVAASLEYDPNNTEETPLAGETSSIVTSGINFESILDPSLTHKNYKTDMSEFTTQIVVAPSFTVDENSVSQILPFYSSLDEYNSLDLSQVRFLKFPIYRENKENNTAKELVGSYTIFNDRIPYIRIKFLNSFFIPGEQYEFLLKYPSNNIKLIRNSIFKLRQISFDENVDFGDIRTNIRNNEIDFRNLV